MASNYWIKLYHEMLDDPKMVLLPDRLWRRAVELFLLAGKTHLDGELPEHIAFCLRVDEQELDEDIKELIRIGILSIVDDTLIVTNFADRQSAMSDVERQQRHRDTKRNQTYYGNDDVTEDVTTCDTESHEPLVDKDKDKDKINELLPNLKTGIEHGEIPVPPIPAYTDLRKTWIELFKNKPAPRENNKTLTAKVKTRMKSQDFYDNWSGAMYRASKHSGLIKASWFDLAWFVNNDDNYEKVLNGKYDWMDKDAGENSPIQLF